MRSRLKSSQSLQTVKLFQRYRSRPDWAIFYLTQNFRLSSKYEISYMPKTSTESHPPSFFLSGLGREERTTYLRKKLLNIEYTCFVLFAYLWPLRKTKTNNLKKRKSTLDRIFWRTKQFPLFSFILTYASAKIPSFTNFRSCSTFFRGNSVLTFSSDPFAFFANPTGVPIFAISRGSGSGNGPFGLEARNWRAWYSLDRWGFWIFRGETVSKSPSFLSIFKIISMLFSGSVLVFRTRLESAYRPGSPRRPTVRHSVADEILAHCFSGLRR